MTAIVERATVYEGATIGIEDLDNPGVPVVATKRLLGCEIDIEDMTDIKPYRPQGLKFNTSRQVGKSWSNGRIQGIQCFNDMLYLAASWMNTTTPTAPSTSPIWNVTGASGPWGFTYDGVVLAPATYATAKLAQAAIEALSTVGVGNVRVTGAAPAFVIEFRGAKSTTAGTITAPTGTPAPTIAVAGAPTLTKRWRFTMNPAGPDQVQTYTVEKGAAGIANYAQRVPFGFVHGLAFKINKGEASLNGEFTGALGDDPFTMSGGIVDVPCVPVDPKAYGVYMGPSLTSMQKMTRILDMEFGVQNRASGLITINDDDVSISNRIETAPDLTTRFFQEHNADGQVMLQRLRGNVPVYTIVEAKGPLIEPGFYYRMKWTFKAGLTKPNTGDVDGAYGKNYDGTLEYDSGLGTALVLEIDSPLVSLAA